MLGTYTKTPAERKRYSIDYADWLDTDEAVIDAVFTITPDDTMTSLQIDANSISEDGTELVFFASNGDLDVNYIVNVQATTSGGQTKENEIRFRIRSVGDV